jgi:hypothetical protein
MRKLLLSLVASAAMGGALMMPTSAGAAVGSLPAVAPAITDSNLVEDVQWRRRCWHRGYSRTVCRYWGGGGHGWRRSRWRGRRW